MAFDPVLQPNGIVRALEQHRGRVEQTRENAARYAQSYATYTTTGVGEFRIEEINLFGCTFSEQPIVSYGFSLPTDELDDLPQVMVTGALPRCSGGVQAWFRDDNEFYVGALVYVTVDLPATAPSTPLWIIDHDFTFTAIAMKDLPAHLLT